MEEHKEPVSRGRITLYPGKIRTDVVSITLTADLHKKVNKAMRRLGLTRADVIALLIDKFSESVTIS